MFKLAVILAFVGTLIYCGLNVAMNLAASFGGM